MISNRYKNILILLLIVTTSPAWADWAAVLKNNSDTHYIDHTNIRRNGQFVKVWALKNSKEKKDRLESSIVTLEEYDCSEERVRLLFIRSFSGQMGIGIPLAEKNVHSEWKYFQPRSPIAFIHALVCHEWVKVDGNVYVDPVSFRRNGQFITTWILFDNWPRNSDGVISARGYYELDCKKLKIRSRFGSGHSDSMAGGNVVFVVDSITQWESVDTVLEKSMLSILCD